ncbi:MAG: RDD family protein [Chloroflexi bacterium]|nr:RDD family protein [Chloroflexota bacterium]
MDAPSHRREPGRGPRGAPASLGRRLVAFVVDVVTAGLLGAPLTAILALRVPDLSETAFDLISQIIGLTVFVIYSVVITTSRGQTLGKYLLGIRIVAAGTLTAPSASQIVTRFLALGGSLAVVVVALPALRVAPAVVGVALAVLAAPGVLRPDRRALHDLMAGTTVIRALGAAPGPEPQAHS